MRGFFMAMDGRYPGNAGAAGTPKSLAEVREAFLGVYENIALGNIINNNINNELRGKR